MPTDPRSAARKRVSVDPEVEAKLRDESEDYHGLRLDPLDTSAVLWVAAIDLLPIEERIAWVEKMKARVAEINAVRVTP